MNVLQLTTQRAGAHLLQLPHWTMTGWPIGWKPGTHTYVDTQSLLTTHDDIVPGYGRLQLAYLAVISVLAGCKNLLNKQCAS